MLYVRWDGSKYTTDPSVEIVVPPGAPGSGAITGVLTGWQDQHLQHQ